MAHDEDDRFSGLDDELTPASRERLRVSNDVIQMSFGLEYRSGTPDGAEHADTATRAAVVYATSRARRYDPRPAAAADRGRHG